MIEEIQWTSKFAVLNDLRFSLRYSDGTTLSTDSPSHIHNGIEFYINLTGNVSFLVDDRLHPVVNGDIIVSRPNVFHHCVYHSYCHHEHYCLWIDAEENSPLFCFLNEEDFDPHVTFDSATKEKELELLNKLFQLQEDETSKGETLKANYFLQFLSLFLTKRKISKETKSDVPDVFLEILKYYDKNATTIRSLNQVADYFFISTATLNRYFKKYLHLSPKDFLESKKLSIAKITLSKGSSVSEAGEEAGFFDTSHFILCFKKKFGITPFQYKRSLLT